MAFITTQQFIRNKIAQEGQYRLEVTPFRGDETLRIAELMAETGEISVKMVNANFTMTCATYIISKNN